MGQTLLGGALTPLESGPIYVNMHTHTHTRTAPPSLPPTSLPGLPIVKPHTGFGAA